MLKKIEGSPIFLIAGIILTGYGAVKTYDLLLAPHLQRLLANR